MSLDKKVLVAYFSWGGNTRHIAQKIQTKTGADIFEIETVKPYPADYNETTVVARQEIQNNTLPELKENKEMTEVLEMSKRPRTLSLVTGKLAYPYIKQIADQIMERFPFLTIYVYAITNEFFGELITVSGLLTGSDIIRQLEDKELGERVLLPQNVLRNGEDYFLDDVTITEMEKALQVKVDIVKSSGYDLVYTILGEDIPLRD